MVLITLILYIVLISVLPVMSLTQGCKDNEIQTPSGCCSTCGTGQFISNICFEDRGVTCSDCKACNGKNQILITSCTPLNDSVCGCRDNYDIASSGECRETQTEIPTINDNTITYSIIFVCLALIVGVVLSCVLARGRRLQKIPNTAV